MALSPKGLWTRTLILFIHGHVCLAIVILNWYVSNAYYLHLKQHEALERRDSHCFVRFYDHDKRKYSPAGLVFGQTTRMPRKFFIELNNKLNVEFTIECLKELFRNTKPTTVHRCNNKKIFVNTVLNICESVFIRDHRLKSSLTPGYDGSFKVTKHSSDLFHIIKNEKETRVNIARIKPAYVP